MDHLGTKELETERLILRRFTVEDAEAMYHNWASDPEVTKFLTWPCHTSPESSVQILTSWVEQYAKANYYQWAIVLKEFRMAIGSIAAVHLASELEKAEIGYCIGRPWWRHGYTSESLRRVIDYMIGEIGANRVEARHDPRNPGSGAVMRKCRMTYEGTLRQADRNNQGVCDACVYAILRSEWLARRQSPLNTPERRE